MQCTIDGCDNNAPYTGRGVCIKHYARFRRFGTYDTTREKRYRYQNPAGYELINEPEHNLADSRGYVYEHRFVYFNEVSETVDFCGLCGDPIGWSTCHIDHIDCDVSNNKKGNLRALCPPCNVFRGHTATSMEKYVLTIEGVSQGPGAWSRAKGVKVSRNTIMRRKQAGMSDFDAVYSERITHKNTKTKVIVRRFDKVRGINL